MALDPKELLRATRPGSAVSPGGGPQKVLITLNGAHLDPPAKERLEQLGLTILETIGNKLVGTFTGPSVDPLRADPAVAEVETSSRLHPH